MPILKSKSNDNLSAANYLCDKGLYAPSIHCFYYSCLQLSKHVLNTNGMSYNVQDTLSRGKDSHIFVINEAKKYTLVPLDYERAMGKLKGLRKKADYDNVEILQQDADKALSTAEKTHKLLGV